MEKTALVLGAGGVFGAYQAGVWMTLADSFSPDLVVGASIGALNGWLIAGGCPPWEPAHLWLTSEEHRRIRPRLPRRLGQGFLDLSPVARVFEDLFARYQPRIEFAAVVTDLLRGKPRVYTAPEITARHLLASCAVPGVFDLQRLDGRICADGGLLNALPVWAAVELGATRIVAVRALPEPPKVLRWFRSAGRRFSRFREGELRGVTVIEVAPDPPLGSFLGMLRYQRDEVERWIARGESDARQVKQSIARCFERQ
jgi:NTE family protein